MNFFKNFKKMRFAIFILTFAWILTACASAEEEFIGDRLLNICDKPYHLCSFPTDCVLDGDHYVEGVFPSARRFTVVTSDTNTVMSIRFFLTGMQAPGSELWLQFYEADCTLNPPLGRLQLEDADIFDDAGDDRMLTYELEISQPGEHVFEIYSDSITGYLLIVEPR